jgi:hypothetical protein
MGRIARWTVTPFLMLVALLLPVGATSAQTGLTFEAQRAELAAEPTVVVLRGTYSCGPFPGGVPDRGVIDLTMRQARPDEQVTGFGFFEPTVCNGTLQRFAASVTAVSGSFRRGPATWSASGFVEGATESQNVFVPDTPIRIKR